MTDERPDPFAAKPWQAKISRRRFLGTSALVAGAAGLAGYLPESLARAASASAATTNGSFDLSQVKHLVFMMQENRSFDHYFGTFPGVVGFSDPHAIKLGDGRSVFQQPDPANPDGYLEPWHMSTVTTGAAKVPSLSHGWQAQHLSDNRGAMDGWLRAHIAADTPARGPFTMGYYTEEDLPFHWTLARAFTLLDHYHCSVMGPTWPNRCVWSNGTIDPQGLANGPVLDTGGLKVPLSLESGADTLLAAGFTFKDYGVNVNTMWSQTVTGADPSSPAVLRLAVSGQKYLFGDGTPGGIGDPNNPTLATVAQMAFEEDCANGVLPDVSFLGSSGVAFIPGNGDPSEHPPGLPAVGAQFIAATLDALAANEDLWNTTLFVLNWDENDGFFDHVPPPLPDPSAYPEEFVTKVSQPGTPGGGLSVGGGFRVPCFVISPWSTGGKIFTQLSDHSSCLQLIEAVAAAGGLSGRGPIHFPNISRWSRATYSDLTGAVVPVAPQPFPTSPEFDPATRAANVTAQQASAQLPLPAFPGANQTMPVQVKS